MSLGILLAQARQILTCISMQPEFEELHFYTPSRGRFRGSDDALVSRSGGGREALVSLGERFGGCSDVGAVLILDGKFVVGGRPVPPPGRAGRACLTADGVFAAMIFGSNSGFAG